MEGIRHVGREVVRFLLSTNGFKILSDLLCLRTDYILFGDEQPEHTAELEMMDALIQKCPPNHQDDLLTMIHAFIHAISEPKEPTE